MDVSDRLEVKVKEAKGLKNIDGIKPNAYIEVECGLDSQSTKHVTENCDPHWNIPAMVFNHLLAAEVDTILIHVKHKDIFGSRDVPLGVAVIPLDTVFNSPKIEIDDWYSLTESSDMSEEASGQVRIVMTYWNDSELDIVNPVSGEQETRGAPNLLQVSILRAIEIGGPKGSLLDTFVIVEVGDLRKETKVVKRSSSPAWDETLDLPVSYGDGHVDIIVKASTLLRRTFLGRVRISMVEVAAAGDAGTQQTYQLLNDNFQFDDEHRGEIRLELKWRFDPKYATITQEEKKSIFRRVVGVIKSSVSRKRQTTTQNQVTWEAGRDRDEEDPEPAVLTLEDQTAQERVRAERKEEIDAYLMDTDNYLDLKDGDYSIQIHIIEVSEIKGLNASGLSDPLIFVEVFDKKQCTQKLLTEVSSAVVDETFYFNFKDLKKEQILAGVIKITVYDRERFHAHRVIGSYQVDLVEVYNSKHHEIYRSWASITNTSKKKKKSIQGSQGLVKFTAICLGPGDSQVVHDHERDEMTEEEQLEDLNVQYGLGADHALKSASMPQELNYLIVGVVRVEGLPGFDRFGGSTGLCAAVQAEFAGSDPIHTKFSVIKGNKNLPFNPDEELWIPAWWPSHSKKVIISIINKEFSGRKKLIATALVDFDTVPRVDKDTISGQGILQIFRGKQYTGPNLRWIQFYGANPDVKNNDNTKLMNKFPDLGAGYRGRALVTMRVIRKPSSNVVEKVQRKPINYSIPDVLYPKMASYCLRVVAYRGADLCLGKAYRFGLAVTIGSEEKRFSYRPSKGTFVDWNEVGELFVDLPSDLSQLPDIFINIYRGSDSYRHPVAFTRLKPVALLAIGFTSAIPKWYELSHDNSKGRQYGYPGCALLKIGFGSRDEARELPDWDPERKKTIQNLKPYCLRVFVYQARHLPCADESGLIDPYVKVRFNGVKRTTERKKMTRNPVFYECLIFDAEIPMDQRLAPNIVIEVWDHAQLSRNIPVAALRLPATAADLAPNSRSNPPTPVWQQLTAVDGTGSMGEILVSMQLIMKSDMNQILERPRSIIPIFRHCWLDIYLIGVRALYKKGLSSVQNPFLRFDVHADGSGQHRVSSSSREPSGTNANFLERITMHLKLPEDPLFTPELEVRCYDKRVGGTRNALVGATAIPLDTKLPWNSNGYIPPRQHQLIQSNTKAQEAMKKAVDVSKVNQAAVDDDDETEDEDFFREDNDSGEDTDEEFGATGESNNESDVVANPLSTKAEAVTDIKISHDESLHPKSAEPNPHDNGLGAFPLAPGEMNAAQHVVELPKVKDFEDVAVEDAQNALEKQGLMDSIPIDPDGKYLDTPINNTAQLRKLIKFPTQWVDTDFLKDRDWWISKSKDDAGELEHMLKVAPFETYSLYVGHIASSRIGARKNTVRQAGTVKAIIRVCTTNPKYDEEYNSFLRTIKTSRPCVARVYVIKCQNLQPKDRNKKSDPYMRISLGEVEQNNRTTHIKETLEPEFFQMFEFQTRMPGPSRLRLQTWDYNFFTFDDFIGETVIDLEDRWFHPEWTRLGAVKPLEVRQLYTPSNRTTQGQIVLWVDIFSEEQAQVTKPVPIAPPEMKKFEIRVICWRCKDVPGTIDDLFVKFWLEQDTDLKQDTDIHWRAKKGEASWNYRLKFPVELPIKRKEFSRLRVQLWDQNVLTSNKAIGESYIDLHSWFLLAYHENRVIHPFKEIKDAKKRQKRMDVGGFSDVVDPLRLGVSKKQDDEESDADAEEDDDEVNQENKPLLGGQTGLRKRGGGGGNRSDLKTGKKKKKKTHNESLVRADVGGESVSADAGVGLKDDSSVKDINQKGGVELQPMDEAGQNGSNEKEKIEADEAMEEENAGGELLKQIKGYLGVDDTIADDAEWIKLQRQDDRNRIIITGRVAISIAIVPWAIAEANKVGKGQEAPNQNPYLPPPFGRMSWSFNPLTVLGDIFGPTRVRIMMVVCCCLCCLIFFLFAGNYIAGFYSSVQMINWFIPTLPKRSSFGY